MRRQGTSRWGQHAAVGLDSTPLYLLEPKHDVHGLGYDPFKVRCGLPPPYGSGAWERALRPMPASAGNQVPAPVERAGVMSSGGGD